MFKTRRKRSYGSYYNYRKKQGKFPLLWIILGIPLGLIILEILSGFLLELTGEKSTSGSQEKNDLTTGYRPIYLTQEQKPIQGLPGSGQLSLKSNLNLGYQIVPGQKNQFFQINGQGFRDKENVPLAKPKDEIRIFILGNSTAFGQGIANNDATISYQLQALLNQRVAQQRQNPSKYRPDIFPFFKPDRVKLLTLPPKIRQGKYRVINAAVPGYISGNSLAQFALEILPYQPDVIIVLDGYMDLMTPSEKQSVGIPKQDEFLENARAHFSSYLNQSFSQWLEGRALSRAVDQLLDGEKAKAETNTLLSQPEGNSLDHYLPENKEELQKRIGRYQENYQQMGKIAGSMGIPILLAIQPEITGIPTNKMTAEEGKIKEQLDKKYQENIPKAYSSLTQSAQQLEKRFPKKVKVLNFYDWNKNPGQPMFTDAIHLTAEGNKAIANQMYNAITSLEKIQIIPQNFYIKEG